MQTTVDPFLVNSITPSLRFYQNILIGILLTLSLICFAGWLFWCTSTEDIEFTRFMAWFFLGMAVIQFLVRLSYNVSFLIDGPEQRVIRIRRLMGWKWTREFPTANYSAVQTYYVEGSDLDGYCLQLIGKERLRLVYTPSENGLAELAEKIASILKLPYQRDHEVRLNCHCNTNTIS